MSVVHILIAAAIGCAMAGIGGYWYGHISGSESTRVRWNAERLAQHRALDEARRHIARIENEAEMEVRAMSEAYTNEIKRRDISAAAARRELDRLRQSIASAASSSNASPAAPDRPPVDGAAPVAGNLLGECAEELVAMGGHAERLSGQVMSLQDYVRTLQRMQ